MRRSFFQSRVPCFCAFCKSERKIYRKRRSDVTNIAWSAFGALVMMFALFHSFDPMVFLFFVSFLISAEIFVQFRWRTSVVCRHCGFDPVLYVKNPAVAAQKVKIRLEERKNDPASLLSRPLNLPKVKPSGRTLSKQI